MPVNDRLSKAFAAIKFQGRAKNQTEIAKELGYQISYLSDMVNSRFEVSEKFTRRLEDVYGINRNWILKGEGSLFIDGNDPFSGAETRVVAEGRATYNTSGNMNAAMLVDEYKRLAYINEKLTCANERLSETNQKIVNKLLGMIDE